jgi:hypothetical protein
MFESIMFESKLMVYQKLDEQGARQFSMVTISKLGCRRRAFSAN